MALLYIAVGGFVLVLAAQIWVWLRDRALRQKGILPPKGQATMAHVEQLLEKRERILAIRVYREVHKVGLKQAKSAVEDLAEKYADETRADETRTSDGS